MRRKKEKLYVPQIGDVFNIFRRRDDFAPVVGNPYLCLDIETGKVVARTLQRRGLQGRLGFLVEHCRFTYIGRWP